MKAIFATTALVSMVIFSLGSSHAAVAQQRVDSVQIQSEQAGAQLMDGLRKVLAGEPSLEDAISIVFEAGKLKDPKLTALLKQVAMSKEDRYSEVVFYALHGLWRLKEPKSYFLDNVKAHQSNGTLAYWSAFILAREPDDMTLKVFDEVAQALGNTLADRGIGGAIAQARYVRSHSDQLGKIAGIRQKITYLLKLIPPGCLVYALDDTSAFAHWNRPSFGYGQQPLQAWARHEVLSMSESKPLLVADAVFRIDLKSDLGIDTALFKPMCAPYGKSTYRQFVARFISTEARTALSQLEKTEKRQ